MDEVYLFNLFIRLINQNKKQKKMSTSTVKLLHRYSPKNLEVRLGKGNSKYKGPMTMWITNNRKPIVLQLSEEFLETPYGATSGMGNTNSERRNLEVLCPEDLVSSIKDLEDRLVKCVESGEHSKKINRLEFISCVKEVKSLGGSEAVRMKVNCSTTKIVDAQSGDVLSVSDIKPHSLMKVILQPRCMWIMDDTYGITLEVKKIQVGGGEVDYDFV